MSVVSMQKITLIGIESEKVDIIKDLMDMGVVEINTLEINQSVEESEEIILEDRIYYDEISKLNNQINDVGTALDVLNRYSPEKKGLFQGRTSISKEAYQVFLQKTKHAWDSVNAIKEYDATLLSLKTEENKLENLSLSLLPWKSLDVKIEKNQTNQTKTAMGVLPATIDIELFKNELETSLSEAELINVSQDKDQFYIFTIVHKDNEEQALSFMKSKGWNKVTFRDIEGTPSANLENIKNRIEEIIKERDEIKKEIIGMADERRSMETLYDHLVMERDSKDAVSHLAETKRAFMFKGWTPEIAMEPIEKALTDKYICGVSYEKPTEDENYPVLLDNNGFFESGEPVTAMYSLPNCKELDPNVIMTPFFVLFFGLMLSDGGYGIIMALLSGVLLLKFKLEDSTKKFMKLMLFCGISTMFWGAMFGGWFGIEALEDTKLWFNMTKHPDVMLSWSLLFGVCHMYVGLGVKAANLLRRKKYLDTLFDVVFWYILFTGFVLFLLPFAPAVNVAKVEAMGLVEIGKNLFIAGAILIVLTQGRAKKGIIGKLFGGIGSLYDVVAFMSDVLSYSRLLALGLATSIIATIVNQMAFMFPMPAVIKIIFGVGILLVGHLINFAINALGAYVHSCRLQYLEFFGKFYTGGGEAFKPLKQNTKYITIKS